MSRAALLARTAMCFDGDFLVVGMTLD